MNRAFVRSTIETGGLPGYTFFPHIGSVRIDGPYDASGAGDTPSRRQIFRAARPSAADGRSGRAPRRSCRRSRRAGLPRPATPRTSRR